MFAKKFNTQKEAVAYYGHTWTRIEKHKRVRRCYSFLRTAFAVISLKKGKNMRLSKNKTYKTYAKTRRGKIIASCVCRAVTNLLDILNALEHCKFNEGRIETIIVFCVEDGTEHQYTVTGKFFKCKD